MRCHTLLTTQPHLAIRKSEKRRKKRKKKSLQASKKSIKPYKKAGRVS